MLLLYFTTQWGPTGTTLRRASTHSSSGIVQKRATVLVDFKPRRVDGIERQGVAALSERVQRANFKIDRGGRRFAGAAHGKEEFARVLFDEIFAMSRRGVEEGRSNE